MHCVTLELQLEMLFPTFKNSTLYLPTVRRQLKHFTSHSTSTVRVQGFFTVNAINKLLLTYPGMKAEFSSNRPTSQSYKHFLK